MKHNFSYLLLIFTALMLLTLIGGVSLLFEQIAATWTISQTDFLARSFSQVLWYGGVVFVSVLGFGLFSNMSRGARKQHVDNQQTYNVLGQDQPMLSNPSMRALPPPAEQDNWYEIEQPSNQVVNR